MNEVQMILTDARARVERRWIQGAAEDSQGGVCAASAIDQAFSHMCGRRAPAAVRYEDRERAYEVLLAAANHQTGRLWAGIPTWNDWQGTSKARVLAVYDEAIARVADPPPPTLVKIIPAAITSEQIVPPSFVMPVMMPVKKVVEKAKDLVGVG